MSSKQKDIPIAIRRQVLMEAGYRCAVPRCRNILAIDLHHMVQVSEAGGNEPGNLIALCGQCHDLYHRGEITKDAIYNWKGMLLALNYAFDRESIDNLIFLRNLPLKTLAISGDGVLHFSKLIAAGLAYFYILKQNGPLVVYDIQLTMKGKMLVDAWLRGDRIAVDKALRISDETQQ